jgi:hypothetical protein
LRFRNGAEDGEVTEGEEIAEEAVEIEEMLSCLEKGV